MEKKINANLTHPLVFSAIFKQARFASFLINSLGVLGTIKEENVIVEDSKIYKNIELFVSDMDVLIRLEDGLVDIEMQNHKTKYDMGTRLVTYLTNLITSLQKRGDAYNSNKACVIGIFNYQVFNDDHYMREFKIRSEYGDIFSGHTIYIFELTKKDKCDKKEVRELLDFLSKEKYDYEEESGIMKDIAKEVETLTANESFLMSLSRYELKMKDYYSEIEAHKKEAIAEGLAQGLAEGKAQGLAEGKAEGLAQGLAQGRAEGKAQGLAEGRAEGRAEGLKEEKLLNAKKMKSKGYPIEDIAEITGLSKEEINKL